MPSRFLLRPLCLAGCLAVVWFVASERRSDARPKYQRCSEMVFKELFPKIQSKFTCNLCHIEGTDDKKKRNHFGQALAEELGEKNVKDEEKIIAAIKAVLKRKCKSGEWGERIEKGLPPCNCGDAECRLKILFR